MGNILTGLACDDRTDAEAAEVASAVWDMHGWFYETTGELNDPKKKQEGTAAAYAKTHKKTSEGSGEEVEKTPLPSYTLAEVAEHTGEDDCWLAIRGNVYDVTGWLSTHPGGKSLLLKHAGGDATVIFAEVEHSPSAHIWLKDFVVGTLAESATEVN